jgi:hypothetical protein
MNAILHLLLATALIAGAILLRMFADRRALQARLRGGHADSECEQAGCFRGCGPDTEARDTHAVAGNGELKRSENHAH